MAPVSANTAAVPHKQGRPSMRIIPAIPHRFTRSTAPARPITPDESTTAAAPKTGAEPEPTTGKRTEERAATPVQVPLTPESNAVDSGHVDESGLAASPARSADDLVEVDAAHAQDHESSKLQHTLQDTSSAPPTEPETAQANGLSKPTAPAELPPEFHPREKPTSQNPSVEGTEVPFTAPSTSLPAHRLQPSVEGLVFGGAVQDSPALPSTPQELEPDAHAQQQAFARPPPGFAPYLAPQFFPGHTHHPSDATAAPWHHPAYTMAPPPEAMYNGRDFLPSSLAATVPAYQAPFPGQFSQPGAPLVLNGGARSHSQSPSKSHFGEEHQPTPYANGHSSRMHEVPHDGYDIAKHLSALFGNPEFTDYILHVRSTDTMLLSMPVHAALVSRSPVILEAIRRSAPPAYRAKDSRRHADILTQDEFVSPESVHEALKILYAAPLLLVEPFLFGLGAYDGNEHGIVFGEARKRMSQAISYAAAGRMLQIPEMYACGSRIVKALLRWDTLDQAIHFGLETGKRSGKPTSVGADKQVADLYAAPALEDALDFVAYNFPADFSLYVLAPELRQNPRLPTMADAKQPTHNPRLSKIRFGDAPPETELMPGHVARILSSVLLSLPSSLLDRLFSHPAAANRVGWSGLVKIMRDVVDEREKRRQKASKNQVRVSPDGAVPALLLENLECEEKVEPAPERPSGYKLMATRPDDPA